MLLGGEGPLVSALQRSRHSLWASWASGLKLIAWIWRAIALSGAFAVGCAVGNAQTFLTTSGTGVMKALSPEQAFEVYQESAIRQMESLTGYRDETTVEAEIGKTSQKGTIVLERTFFAPGTLAYKTLMFEGDTFIKNNVIARLLQSEVDHVRNDQGPILAILTSNYKFSFKGIEELDGRRAYAFALKPRRKQPGLFRGKVFLDCQTGHIIRATGRLSKSPSWWIKRVDFTEDYIDVDKFTMPTQIRALTRVRIVGLVSVTIRHSAYQVHSNEPQSGISDKNEDHNLVGNTRAEQ